MAIRLNKKQLLDLKTIKSWACCFEPERRFWAEVKVTQLEAENERLEKFVHLVRVEWTTLESAESEGVVRVEYPADVHNQLKALGGE